ncbi:MAG: hypothetical protein E7411_06410 [Ruminococcaceae bacterium]|nr:hypothetical protein [Oscillospiraceae bacterium]
MKKILSLFLSLTLILSMASFISVSAADEVIFSDSFEEGMSNWVYSSSKCNEENTKPVTDKASDGKTSVYVYDAGEGTFGYRGNMFPAEPGKTYIVSYDHYNIEGCGAKIFVEFLDDADKRIQSTSFGSSKTGQWESLTKDFVAPAGTKSFRLHITGSGSGSGKSYIDNLKVVLGSQAAVTPPEVVVKPAATATGDTLFSESFENGSEGWAFKAAGEGAKPEVKSTKATDGKNSVYMEDTDTTSGSASITSPLIAVEPSKNYTATADFIDAEGVIKLYVQYFDKDGKRINSTSASSKAGAYTAKVTVAAPEGAVGAKVIISTNSTSEGKGYVDNIKFIAAAPSKEAANNSVISEINAKIASAKPGDVIEIPDGTYDSVRINFTNNGTEDKPITLKAKNPGKAIFTGESTLRVTGSYLITEGLLFTKVTTKFIFVFEDGTHHSQIKECAFIDNDPVDAKGKIDPTGQQKWIYIRGQYNKVTNCYMRGKTALGMMAEVIRTSADPDYHIIENCYFGDYKDGTANGLETVRIGTSTQSLSSSYSTVTGCFFESCNGEVETISVKSCNNYVLNNTLYNNKGAIVLRHGNGTEVRGNLIIGGDATSRPTGVRVIGEDHKVVNNYFYNTPANSTAVYVSNGNPNPLIHEYLEVKNADIHNNTFVNNDTAIVAGEYAPSETNASNRIIAPKGKIYNNAIISYKGMNPLITGDKNATELTFENNYAFGKDINYDGGMPSGITNEKFDYDIIDGFVVPKNGTGADIEDLKKAPKSPFEVMPKWVKEQYYDTGKIKFNIVENDPFNDPSDSVEDLIPEEGKIKVLLNGENIKFDVEPQIINSRTMVPMRAIFEKLGAEVIWDEATASATASTFDTTIKITRDSEKAYVNGQEFTLDSPATIIDGRFLVPIRFISESFGAKVEWIDATKTVSITYVLSAFRQEFKPQHSDIAGALTVYGAVQSDDDGGSNITNIFDGSTGTKWAFKGDGSDMSAFAIIDLGESKTLDKLYMALQSHATRVYTFEIYVSDDNRNYTKALEKTSTPAGDGKFNEYSLNGAKGRYVKYVGYGNTDNSWNNITELVITGK